MLEISNEKAIENVSKFNTENRYRDGGIINTSIDVVLDLAKKYNSLKLDEKEEIKSPSFTKEQLDLMNLGVALYKNFEKIFNDKEKEEEL